MKYLISALCILFVMTSSNAQDKVNWVSWEEAMTAAADNPKKVYIDIYTDWCGYCKKMDRETFTDPEVVKYLNENFYPVKFDAEQKEEITFNETSFKHRPGGRGGVHELAVALLNNQMGYPAFVILDEEFARILISPGYKGPKDVMMEMEFANEEMYKTKGWNAYKAEKTAAQRAEAAKALAAKTANNTPAKAKVNQQATPAKPNAPATPAKPATAGKQATPSKPAAPAKPNVTGEANKATATKRPPPPPPVHPGDEEEELYKVVEEMPIFAGCDEFEGDKMAKRKCGEEKMLQFIYKNLKYPDGARKKKVDGMVVVQFTIGKNGAVRNAKVVRNIGEGCGEAALEVVNAMPTWTPGKQRGKPVAVLYTLPVRFKLEDTPTPGKMKKGDGK